MSIILELRSKIEALKEVAENSNKIDAYTEIIGLIDDLCKDSCREQMKDGVFIVKVEKAEPNRILVYNKDKSEYHEIGLAELIAVFSEKIGSKSCCYCFASKINGEVIVWNQAPDQTW